MTEISTPLDKETGDRQWTFETTGTIVSSPTVVGGSVLVGSTDYNLYAVDMKTGDQQWKFTTRGPVESSPIVVDGTAFVGSGDGNIYALDVGDKSSEGTRVLSGTIGNHSDLLC